MFIFLKNMQFWFWIESGFFLSIIRLESYLFRVVLSGLDKIDQISLGQDSVFKSLTYLKYCCKYDSICAAAPEKIKRQTIKKTKKKKPKKNQKKNKNKNKQKTQRWDQVPSRMKHPLFTIPSAVNHLSTEQFVVKISVKKTI